MGQNVHLILGSHAHVPFGAGDEEFEKTYALKLRPFISTLYKYPKIQLSLHYSGVLLHWLEKVHPEFLMLIEDLVSRKQVELLGGGFYEPMFSLIPLQDKIGQIELLTTYLRKQFGKRPQGCWIPPLCWEQNLVSPLSASGMAYIFLDEGQFTGEPYTPCISEDQGKLITVFPLSGALKAAMAQGNPQGALEKLALSLPADQDRVLSVFPESGPDPRGAEIFWHEFFEDLSRCESFLEFTSPGKYLKGRRGLQRAYFPDSRGRQYLIEYPEANGIYSKMVFSHTLINQLRGDKSRKRTAREELWKAQGFEVFCPQGSGGICRSSIRKTAYRALLGAEKITRETKAFIPSLMNFDFDLDNEGEYLFQGERINCYIRLEGAGIFELDYLPKTWNYLDTFSCQGSDGGSGGPPAGNPAGSRPVSRRGAFSDRLLPLDISPEDAVLGGGARSAGTRFCGAERFELAEMEKARGKVSFTLPGKKDLPFGQIGLEKSYQLRKDTLTVAYTLSNRGTEAAAFQFAPGIDLSFPGEGEDFVRVLKGTTGVKPGPDGAFSVNEAESLKFQDLKNEVVINLGSAKPFDAFVFPVRSPCDVGGTLTDLYQSTCIMPLLKVTLNPGETWKNEFTLKISH
ncbi:glycosyl hydrolase [Spirochaetia bacterium]|nr:glycosyl hydrolase [Spirochaetia bacterium]